MALHTTAVASMGAIQAVLPDLESGNVTTEPMDDCTLATIASLNGMAEFTAFSYSKFSYDELQKSINCTDEHIQDTWGYNKAVPVVDTYAATTNVLAQLEEETPDYSASIDGYKAAYAELQTNLVSVLGKEINGFGAAIDDLK